MEIMEDLEIMEVEWTDQLRKKNKLDDISDSIAIKRWYGMDGMVIFFAIRKS